MVSRFGYSTELTIRDEETANRLAKAFNHAVELCGGGSKRPFLSFAMKLSTGAVFFIFLGIQDVPTLAQQNIPPPPKPKVDGPSLEVTMKFIQDKLSGQGIVSTILIRRNTLKNEESVPMKFQWIVTEASAVPGSCKMSLHQKDVLPNSGGVVDNDLLLFFADVASIEAMSEQELMSREMAKSGEPELVADGQPAVYVLNISMSSGKTVELWQHLTPTNKPASVSYKLPNHVTLYFQEEQLAERMAKALVHAVELCGGGSKDPF